VTKKLAICQSTDSIVCLLFKKHGELYRSHHVLYKPVILGWILIWV